MKEIKAILYIAVTLLSLSCKNNNEEHTGHEMGTYYTCPMHPSVQSNSPGACPVCNMSLIKVEKKKNHMKGTKAILLHLMPGNNY